MFAKLHQLLDAWDPKLRYKTVAVRAGALLRMDMSADYLDFEAWLDNAMNISERPRKPPQRVEVKG